MSDRTELGIQEARDGFRDVVDDALVHRKPTIITRHGKPVAAVIPYEWFEEIEKLHGRDTPRSSA